MKTSSCFFKISLSAILHKIVMVSCCAAAILLSVQAIAQAPKFLPATPTATLTHPLPYSNFKASALYVQRQKLYFSTFNNPSKNFTMADGTILYISYIKNPPFANQPNNIEPTIYTGLVHGVSTNIPVQSAAESNNGWACNSSSAANVHASSVNFNVTDYTSQAANIYPGALFTFDNLMNNSFQTPSGARNPIVVATDHPSTSSFINVTNPSPSTVQNAVSTMVGHFMGAGNTSTTYKYFESNNMADWTLKVNAGGNGYGSGMNNDFNNTDRRHHRYITIDVTKQLFNIFTNPPANGFYSATNSTEATPNLMIVGSVNYGVRLLVNMELTFANNADAVAFNNSFAFLSYSDNMDMSYLQNHASEITQISSYEIGGPNSGTVFVNKNSLQSNINNILSSVTNQNAKPVSYQLYDMAWDMIGANAGTNTFSYTNCVPALPAPPPPPANPVLASASLSITCGSDGKNHSSSIWSNLWTPQNQQAFEYDDGNAGRTWPANATVTPLTYKTLPCNCNSPFHLNDFTDTWKVDLSLLSGAFNSDDIKNFSLTLTLGFMAPNGQYTIPYNVTWHNLNLSSGFSASSSPDLYLPFNYSNGRLIPGSPYTKSN